MFSREARTNLSLLRPETGRATHANEIVAIRRQLIPEGVVVQATNFNWKPWVSHGIEKGNVLYSIRSE